MTDPTTQPAETEAQPGPSADPAGEVPVARGELVDASGDSGTPDASGDSSEVERREAVEEPAKVLRIGSMVKQLLDEVRNTELDAAARHRLREIYDASIKELGSALSADLQDELERMAFPFGENDEPSDAELRMAKAQLVGWLEGLFHGIQATLFAQQAAARNQFEGMRHQLAQGGPPGMGASPGGDDSRSGTYL